MTGLVRGWLCPGCNGKEGHAPAPGPHVWAYCRERSPYSMMGIKVRYVHPIWGEAPDLSEQHARTVDKWNDNAVKGIGL